MDPLSSTFVVDLLSFNQTKLYQHAEGRVHLLITAQRNTNVQCTAVCDGVLSEGGGMLIVCCFSLSNGFYY